MKIIRKVELSDAEIDMLLKVLAFGPDNVELQDEAMEKALDKMFDGAAEILNMDDKGKQIYTEHYGAY